MLNENLSEAQLEGISFEKGIYDAIFLNVKNYKRGEGTKAYNEGIKIGTKIKKIEKLEEINENEKEVIISPFGKEGREKIYEYADLLIYDKKKRKLVVYEFTIRKKEGEKLIFRGNKFNYLEDDIVKYTKAVKNVIEESLKEGLAPSNESIKLLQTLRYALSYLMEKELFVDVEIEIKIIMRYDAKIIKLKVLNAKKEEIEKLLKEINELYKKVSDKKSKKVKKEEDEELDEELKVLGEEKIKIEKDINEIRKEVEKIVKEAEDKKLHILAYAPGSGKTTALLKRLKNEDENVVLIYFASRLKLLMDLKEKLEEKLKGKKFEIRKYYGKDIKEEKVKFYQNDADIEFEGKLKRMYQDLIKEKEEGKDYNKMICYLISLQTLVNVRNFDTFKNLEKVIEELNRMGKKVILVIDEVMGSENGMLYVEKMKKIIKKYNVLGILIDANLHSYEIVKELLRNLKKLKKETEEEFVIYKENPKWKGEIGNIKVYSAPSYFSKEVVIKKSFLKKEGKAKVSKSKLVDKLIKLIKERKRLGKKIYIYIEDKEVIVKLAKRIYKEEKGIKLNVLFHESDKEIEENFDVVIGTSSSSRGIDIPSDEMYAIFFEDKSVNLSELIQSVYRMRGGEKEKEKKEINLIYYGKDEERALRVLNFVSKVIRSFIKEEKKIYVPVKGFRKIDMEKSSLSLLSEIINIKEVLEREGLLKEKINIEDFRVNLMLKLEDKIVKEVYEGYVSYVINEGEIKKLMEPLKKLLENSNLKISYKEYVLEKEDFLEKILKKAINGKLRKSEKVIIEIPLLEEVEKEEENHVKYIKKCKLLYKDIYSEKTDKLPMLVL